MRFGVFAFLVLSLQLGCSGSFKSTQVDNHDSTQPGGSVPSDYSSPSAYSRFNPAPVVSEKDVFKYFPQGMASLKALCDANRGSDKFTQALCGANAPTINSLASLNVALGLNNAANTACTTASGSLSKKEASVLTPRCIRFSQPGYDPNAVAVGYVRSTKTFAEIVAFDPALGFRFYLVKFDLPCEASNSCTNADYMNASAESNWQNVSFYEDTQLKNTVMDCTSCHQPKGVNTQKALLMVETGDPWSHWLRVNRPCGQQLLTDYINAHGTESEYANLTPQQINNSDPGRLQAFVENNGFLGPQFGNNIYDSGQILYEAGMTPGISATWQSLYNQRINGANQPTFGGTALPYPDCKQSDPAKLAPLTANFKGVMNGTIARSAAINLSEVNLSTTDALAKRFLIADSSSQTAQQILANACLSCHNSNLDQTISRARFNAQDLSKNTPYEYGIALGRIQRAANDLHRMPPPSFMNLNANQIQTLSEFFAAQGGK